MSLTHKNLSRILLMLIILSAVAPLAGCSMAFCADGNDTKPLTAYLENAADKAVQAAQKAGKSLGNAMDAILENSTRPREDIPSPEDTTSSLPEPIYTPRCSPFDKTLNVITAYEEDMVFVEGAYENYFAHIYGISVYALSALDFSYKDLQTEFERIYGSTAVDYTQEMVGQFYVDGEDWVPVYKFTLQQADYTPIWDDAKDGFFEIHEEDGSYVVGFRKIFAVWGNGDCFDKNSDSWAALGEYENTAEYRDYYEAMLDRMIEISGKTIGEMHADERFTISYFAFTDKAYTPEGEAFSAITYGCRYNAP